MRLSKTLSLYIIKNILVNLLYVFLCFCFISFILDLLEIFRKVQGKEIVVLHILKISFYKVPFLVYNFLPFIFLFAAILTFTKLNNNFEIAAAKSAGVSIWALSAPIVILVAILGLLIILLFQPISAIFLDKNRILENKYFNYKTNRVSLNPNGIWLHDQASDGSSEKFINAKHVTKLGQVLSGVTVYDAGTNEDFINSFFAETAYLKDNKLVMNNVLKYDFSLEPIHFEEYSLPTNLRVEQIQESIANPEIIPFWYLSAFIKQIKEAGFSTLKHELYYKSLLVSPIMYLSLILISLSCSINLPRKGKVGLVFIVASVISILIFFTDKIINVMALTSILPIDLAVIAPSLVYFLLSCIMLVHFEET